MTDIPRSESFDWDLARRVVSGEALGEERARLAAWVGTDDARQAYVESLRDIWRTTGTLSRPDVSAKWMQFVNALPASSVAESQGGATFAGAMANEGRAAQPSRSLGLRRRPYNSVLQGGALAAAAALMLWVYLGTGSVQPMRELVTPAGSRASVTLRDGTQLTLGPATHLRIPADFGRRTRELTIDGEALLHVVHDSRHPFIVHTPMTDIRDIGTTFAVHAYSGDGNAQVTVTEGEISLRSRPPLPLTPSPVAFGAGRGEFINSVREGGSEKRAPSAPVSATRPYDGNDTTSFGNIVVGEGRATANDTAYLTAGDMAEVTETGLTLRHHVDIAEATAWVQGALVFRQTPLREVVREVSRAYGITVTVADSVLANETVTASFTDEPIDDVLEAVTRAVGAAYTRTGKQVNVSRRVVPVGHAVPARTLVTDQR